MRREPAVWRVGGRIDERDFVPWHSGQFGLGQFAIDRVQVGAAHAAGMGPPSGNLSDFGVWVRMASFIRLPGIDRPPVRGNSCNRLYGLPRLPMPVTKRFALCGAFGRHRTNHGLDSHSDCATDPSNRPILLVLAAWHGIRRLTTRLITARSCQDSTMIAIAGRPIESHRDRQICVAAKAALGASKYVPLRRLHCRVFGGVLEISGAVSSFYLKQLAQEAVLQLNPSGAVRNLVEVTAEPGALVATSCASWKVSTAV
jgi:hypothetical protein